MCRWAWVVSAATVIVGLALTPDAARSQEGLAGPEYESQQSQTVQQAPPGWVGRKTTDRGRRVGKTADTQGNESTTVLTIGGFAKRCPTAEGLVEGNFEYLLTYDEARNAGGATQRTRVFRHFVARLKGYVGEDARLQYVEMEGEYTVARDVPGELPSSDRRPVRATFRAGAGGEPDWEAMKSVAEMAADVAIANVVLMGGTMYATAELEWLKENACVEFTFDPPTDSRALAPNEAAQVRIGLRTKEGGSSLAWKTDSLGPLQGIGSVSPRKAEAQPGAPATITYTASSKPRRGHGIELASLSRAGLGSGKWRIIEPARFEGRFTQTDSVGLASGLGKGTNVEKVTGTLVWTPEEEKLPSLPTFGEVRSSFFRPSAGEFMIEFDYDFQGVGGSACKQYGRKTFSLAGLPKDVLRYLWLEIAENGRYKLSLGLPDRVWQVWKMDVESVCTFPGGRVVRDKLPVNQIAVQLGVQHGTLNTNQDVVGELAAPIRRGPRTITGNWSFARKTD